MDKIVVASQPPIAAGSCLPEPVLTLKELLANVTRISTQGTWKSTQRGHFMLPWYLDDGTPGKNRPVIFQMKGFSAFGLGFFDEEKYGKKDKVKKEKKDKEGETPEKPRIQPANIALDHETSPDVQAVDVMINSTVRSMMDKHLPMLEKLLAPGADDTLLTCQRRAARCAAGSSIKTMRITAFPGKVQLESLDRDYRSMQDYEKREGDYLLVIHCTGIDASLEKSVISYGPVFYAKIIKMIKDIPQSP